MQIIEKHNQDGSLKENMEKYIQDKGVKEAFEKILAMSNEITKTVLFVGNLLSIDPLNSVLLDHKMLVTNFNNSKIDHFEPNVTEKDIEETFGESNTNLTDTNETRHNNEGNYANTLHKEDSEVEGTQAICSSTIDELPKEVSNDENVEIEQTSITDGIKKGTSKVGVVTTIKPEYLEDIKPFLIKQEPHEDYGLFPIKQELDEENDGWTKNLATNVAGIKTEKTCTGEVENFIQMTNNIPKSINNADDILRNNYSNSPSSPLDSNPPPSLRSSNFPKPPEESSLISRYTSPKKDKVAKKNYSGSKKRSLCRDYNEKGVCQRGNLCQFFHGDGAVVIPQNAQPRNLLPYGLPRDLQYVPTRGWPQGLYMAAATPYTRQGPQKREKRDVAREEVSMPIQNGILDKKKKTYDNGEEKSLKEERNLKNNRIVQEDLEVEDLEELVRIKNEELLSLYDVDNDDVANSDINLYENDMIRREEGDEIEDGEIL